MYEQVAEKPLFEENPAPTAVMEPPIQLIRHT